jgi:hypothetical protein
MALDKWKPLLLDLRLPVDCFLLVYLNIVNFLRLLTGLIIANSPTEL